MGLVNTCISLSIMYLLTKIDISIYRANIIAYVAGIILSFILNSIFTFKVRIETSNLIKFIVVVFISYLTNLLIIYFTVPFFYPSKMLPQAAGMIIYTIVGFILNKKFTFRAKHEKE